MKKPISYTLVVVLLRSALKIMPEKRREWGQAMMYETMHQTSEYQALLWALGCLKTAIMERILTMKTGTLHVSKSVLSLEVLCCFIPLCFVLMNLIVELLTVSSMDKDLLVFVYSAIAFNLIGPAGLILGFRYLLNGSFRMGLILQSLFGLLAAGTVVAPFWFMQFTAGNIRLDNAWLVIAMIGVLPALAIFHLIFLAQDKRSSLA